MIRRTLRLFAAAPATACVSQIPVVTAAAPAAAAETCAVKSKPAGKVLQGYWENWDGAANGVHPPSSAPTAPPCGRTAWTPG